MEIDDLSLSDNSRCQRHHIAHHHTSAAGVETVSLCRHSIDSVSQQAVVVTARHCHTHIHTAAHTQRTNGRKTAVAVYTVQHSKRTPNKWQKRQPNRAGCGQPLATDVATAQHTPHNCRGHSPTCQRQSVV